GKQLAGRCAHSSYRPRLNCTADRTFQLISRQTPIGFGAQPQEVFNVARWARERARGDPDGVPTELAGATRDGEHGTRPELRTMHNPAGSHLTLTHLELRLHHGNDIR